MINNSSILKKILQDSYLFCVVPECEVARISNFKRVLKKIGIQYFEIPNIEMYSLLIFHSNFKDVYTHTRFINEQKDYNVEDLIDNNYHKTKIHSIDTLISFSFTDFKIFYACNDYLGIFRHYYTQLKEDSFIASNNSFLIAALIDSEVSSNSIYDTLFFRFPYKSGSYFDKVKSLSHNEVLEFDIINRVLNIDKINYPKSIKDYYSKSASEGLEDFWQKIAINTKSRNIKVSFSGGSDSMTVVSILDKFKYNFDLLSFEGHNQKDTDRIVKLASSLNKNIDLIKTKENSSSEDDIFEYTVLSNGFIVSDHFYHFYKKCEWETIFDGYSFVLGDWSDAFISNIHKDVLLNKSSLKDLFQKYYYGFSNQFIVDMLEYIASNYEFPDGNSSKGLDYVQHYSIDFICSRILAGVILPANYFKVKNFSYFLSKKFFCPILNSNYGISRTFSSRNDYPGYIINRLPLAQIASGTKSKAFTKTMDNGISLKDILYNNQLTKVKMLFYKKKKAIINKLFGDKNIKSQAIQNLDSFPSYVIDSINLNSYAKNQLKIISTVENSLNKLKKLVEIN